MFSHPATVATFAEADGGTIYKDGTSPLPGSETSFLLSSFLIGSPPPHLPAFQKVFIATKI